MRKPIWFAAALTLGAAASSIPGCSHPTEQGVTSDPGAASCATCHSDQATEWRKSRHSVSGASPVFNALLPAVARAWGDAARARCVSCHTPGHGGDDGIGCVACHSAIGNSGDSDGRLLVDLGAPISGPFGDAIATPAHGSRTYDFLPSAELCGTCHEVTGPNLFKEPALTEYRASPAAANGKTCASCHMSAVLPGPIVALAPDASGPASPRATGLATPVRARVDHSFAGIDPAWGAPPDEAANAAAHAAALVSTAIQVNVTPTSDHGLDVSLTNQAGHAVPSGAAFLRRIWIDVTFTDASGATNDENAVLVLGADPEKNGVATALITDADDVRSHVLAPGAVTTVHVAPPSAIGTNGGSGNVASHATVFLRARAITPEALHALGLEARESEVPILEAGSFDVTLR